ncbi:hypothetical protein G7Y79_00017g043930 [Physcia stellaris]|nr:hypothetical protein G7Y79_00017g043930 [Physcia stellaris]
MLGFLDLPREIRDQIYVINLVHGTIPIGTSDRFLHTRYGPLSHVEPEERTDKRGNQWHCYCENCAITDSAVLPIIRRNTKRSVRDVPAEGYLRFYRSLKDRTGTLISNLQESYGQPDVSQIDNSVSGFLQKLTNFDPRILNIFLANRQIYQEASAIFYSRNKFDFCYWNNYGYSASLRNASDFLQDRSKHARAHLKSIRLALGRNSRDKLVEESWYYGPELKALCEILGNDSLLSELSLGIFGTYHSSVPHPCLKQLVKIKGVRNLRIWIEGRDGYGVLESSLATIKAFRCQSLIGGDKMGEDGIDISKYISVHEGSVALIRVSTWKPEREHDWTLGF